MHRNTRHCEIKGVWSSVEHERFLEAMTMYPVGPWKLITDHIGTRSIKQVQTHAQKYQQKLLRQQRGLRKRKTKVKQPEHRVDETTLGQFTHKSILRYAQRRVKEQEEAAGFDLPESPVDATFLEFNVHGVMFEDWTNLASDPVPDIDLLDLLPEQDRSMDEEEDEDDDDEMEVPKFDAMYDPPSDWNAWQLDDLLQPTTVDPMLATDKGGHPDGSELPLLECTV